MSKKNLKTINEFLVETLGLQLTSRRWSWDAYADDVVMMKLWKNRRQPLPNGIDRIEVWAPPPWEKPARAARNERRRNIERLKAGGATYAVLRGGVGSDDQDSRDYNSESLFRLGHVEVDPDGYEYAVVQREVSISDFLVRSAGSHATSIVASELVTVLESLGSPGVVTKNNDPESEKNYRPRPGHLGDMLDGYWTGQPSRVLPSMGFSLHLVERHHELWLGDYLGTIDEGGGRFSLIVGNAQRFHIVDLDFNDPNQAKLKRMLKQPGAVTYSYIDPTGGSSQTSGDAATDITSNGPAYRMTEVKQRLQQRAFRTAVFARHGKRCIVTGCDVEELLEAAHLAGRNWQDGNNTGTDGIPLRVDIHRAYDKGLIVLDENHRICHINPALEAQYQQYRRQ
jgi:putative restriction endonuclease